ncbi:MAG: type I pullulanase [bacterium]|nr:type I pullulanase [bacterium]
MNQLATSCTCLTIHYHRYDGRYDDWYLWIWLEGRPGALFEFTGHDDYGVFSRIDCQKLSGSAKAGILIKKSRDRWDRGKEETRFIDIAGSVSTEIWLLENDPNIYYVPPEIKINVIAAFVDDPRTITVNLSAPIVSDERGELKAVSFSLRERGGGLVPISAIRNKNLLGQKTSFNPRKDGYEILENGAVHFIYDPAQADPGERLEGPRSVFVLGNHNGWQQGEGDPRWKMWWNEKERYYELIVYGFPHDGSIQFKFKETLDNPDHGWVPGIADPPFMLLGLQTRKLVIELEKDLDIRQEYYLDKDKKVIPRNILASPRFFYEGSDLGVTYSPQAATFKVFAPMAESVSVLLYPDLWSDQAQEVPMTSELSGRLIPQTNGIWSTTVPGDLKGRYYTFRLTCHGKQSEVMDPYCRCACSKIKGILTVPEHASSSERGVSYTPQAIFFHFPFFDAQNMSVVLYRSFDDRYGIEVPLSRDEHGVFQGSQAGDWKDAFYLLRVTDQDGREREIVDPWAEMIAIGPSRGKIVDFQEINRQIGWDEDHRLPFREVIPEDGLIKPEDAIIYELHLRDFTIAANSGVKNKGLYTGLIETGTRLGTNNEEQITTGLDHLLELGVTHIQIMPLTSFTSWTGREQFQLFPHYNWGYMPTLFFSPEATYASNPTDETIIKEFKQMIKELHRYGLRVIMDVVYNHYDSQAPFDQLAPYYYYRMDEEGRVANGSGTGNEFNTTYPMARKLLLDSVKFWAQEYHIDGFRFDLMGLIDVETMTKVAAELHAIDPTILVYGEPWSAGPSPLEVINEKGKQKGRGYGVFNDHFRNTIKGSPNGPDQSFIQGHSSIDIAASLCRGLRGSIEDFAHDPDETINYVTCHDDLVLRDKLEVSVNVDENIRKRMVKLAGLLVLLAQGIPFLYSGMEMYRTKQHIANTYNQPDSINRIDWHLKSIHADIFRYLKGVITLRKQHPAFRLGSAEKIYSRVQTSALLPEQIIYSIDGSSLSGEPWSKILVLINGSSSKATTFLLPEGVWREVRLESGVPQEGEIFSSSMVVEPTSAVVLHSEAGL